MGKSSNSIRVLHIINDLSVGGAEIMLYRLLSEMDDERFSCSVVSLKNSGALRTRIEALGVPVHTLQIDHALPTPATLWRLVYLLRNIKPDVIQGWLPHANLAALLAGNLSSTRVPVVWNILQSLHGLEYEKPVTVRAIKLGARLSHKPAGIIYNSENGATQHTAFGYSSDNSKVIYNGFNTQLFAPSFEARQSVRLELGLTESSCLIGLIGRYHAIKNHSNFLHAAALLRRRYPNARFVLSGNGIGFDNPPLRALIRELGLNEHVHLLGERQDIERVTAALDVAASASEAEGFPNVIGEAMACAVPCVATDVGDLAWIMKGAGLIVPTNDPPSMAQAFTEILELGAEGRRSLGAAGRARIMEFFRLDTVAAQYGAFYENIVSRKERQRIKMRYRSAYKNYSNRSPR